MSLENASDEVKLAVDLRKVRFNQS
ncbi:DUF2496 domain-containing protein [Klebsiella pneumoniae subsp. pneumoniae]